MAMYAGSGVGRLPVVFRGIGCPAGGFDVEGRLVLSTIAKHAGTALAEILMRATDEILLHDTIGPDETIPDAALNDFRAQAAVHGGTLTATSTHVDRRACPHAVSVPDFRVRG